MSDTEKPIASEEQSYDDNDDGLHPDDVLITKWFPEYTTLELLDAVPDRWRKLEAARQAEDDVSDGTSSRVPPQVPWPKPPPRPRSELEPGIEEWRQPQLQMANELISQWTPTRLVSQQFVHPRITSVPSSKGVEPVSKGHLALRTAELRGAIIQLLDPESQIQAMCVSSDWRDTVQTVLEIQYRAHYPCAPIGYNERISPGLYWAQPNEEEVIEMEKDVFHRLTLDPRTARPRFPYYPARLTQAQCLSEATSTAVRRVWNTVYEERREVPALPLDPFDNRWLDLSQVELNPYFTHLFGKRLDSKRGRIEIELLPGPEPTTLSPFANWTSLAPFIRPMLATQPPCKGLGIYIAFQPYFYDIDQPFFKRLAHIRDEDGVRIGQLLDALHQHSAEAIAAWTEGAIVMRDFFQGQHWTEFSLDRAEQRERSGLLACDVHSKIMILLDAPERDGMVFAECLVWLTEETAKRQEREWAEAFTKWSEKKALEIR